MDGGEGMQLVLESLGLCPSISAPPPFIKDGTVMSQECWYMALVAAARETEAARPCEQLRALKPNLGDTGGPHTKTKTNNQLTKQTKLGNGPHYLIFMTIDR